jgi:hypothetical protein
VTRCTLTSLALLLLASSAWSAPFKTKRPVRAVVFGGSVSEYYRGNYGEFLQFGCKHLEVINRAKQKKGVPALVKRLHQKVLKNRSVMAQVRAGEAWLIFQGGLNSVYAPAMANYHLARLFKTAHDAGFKTMALTLTPWGSDEDIRFRGVKALRTLAATHKINDFLLGRSSPDAALGRRARKHPHEWMQGELPAVTVDIYNGELRDSAAPLANRDEAKRAVSNRRRYRRNRAKASAAVERIRAVPRYFMKRRYWAFNHYHPNTAGHRVIALAVCANAPPSWGCDCERIRHAIRRRGKIRSR